MPEKKTRPPLVDQHLLYAPEFPDGSPSEDHTDLDVIANTYRWVIDDTAFDDMISGWERRLVAAEKQKPHTSVSTRLFNHLVTFRDTLENLATPLSTDPLKVAVSDLPGPAMVMSPNGRVVTINVAGERAFGVRQGAKMNLDLISPQSRDDYAALVHAASARGNSAHAILTLDPAVSEYGETMLAEAYLIRAHGQNRDHIAIRSLEITWAPRASERLQQAFGLTQAECDVAELFFLTRSLEAIANQRQVSLLTVRTQIKTIMSKIGAASNVDLMRFLAMIAAREQSELSGEAPVWHDPLGREEILEAADGRRIAWTWMGDRTGTPVILVRGMTMAYLLSTECEARLKKAGICLYLPSRPGYGNSTIDPSQSVLDDSITALTAFMDRVVGCRCLAVGQTDAVLPLIAMSAADPNRFLGLIAIGYVKAFDMSGIQRLPRIQRVFLQLAGTTPWVAEILAKTGHRKMQQQGLDWYLEHAFRNTPANQIALRNPDCTALIRNACEHALKQGHVTFVRELQLPHSPIDAALKDLAVPLLYLAPLEDRGIDRAACERLQKVNGKIGVEFVENASELLLYQRSDLVLDRIIAAARSSALHTPVGV